MPKHTASAGSLPNGSIDFDKVQANARAGKDDIFEGAVTKERGDPAVPDAEAKVTQEKVAAAEEKAEAKLDGARAEER